MVHLRFAIIAETTNSSIQNFFLETTNMKKILALAIGLGVVLGTVSFAQDKMADTTKMEKKKGGKKTKKTEEKKDKM